MKTDGSRYVALESDNIRGMRKRQRIIRIVIPVSFVAVVIAGLLIISYQSYEANHKAALVLSNDLLQALDRRQARQEKMKIVLE